MIIFISLSLVLKVTHYIIFISVFKKLLKISNFIQEYVHVLNCSKFSDLSSKMQSTESKSTLTYLVHVFYNDQTLFYLDFTISYFSCAKNEGPPLNIAIHMYTLDGAFMSKGHNTFLIVLVSR